MNSPKSAPNIFHTFATITVGSHLYGTATENSDKDVAVVYAPKLLELISSGPQKITHINPDENGNDISYIPLNTFIEHFACGKQSAFDLAMYVYSNPDIRLPAGAGFRLLVNELVYEFFDYARVCYASSAYNYCLGATSQHLSHISAVAVLRIFRDFLQELQKTKTKLEYEDALALARMVNGRKGAVVVCRASFSVCGKSYYYTSLEKLLRIVEEKLTDEKVKEAERITGVISKSSPKHIYYSYRAASLAVTFLSASSPDMVKPFPLPETLTERLIAIKNNQVRYSLVEEWMVSIQSYLKSYLDELDPKYSDRAEQEKILEAVERFKMNWNMHVYELKPENI